MRATCFWILFDYLIYCSIACIHMINETFLITQFSEFPFILNHQIQDEVALRLEIAFMEVNMLNKRPQPPQPDRIRVIHGSFSWIDHRFLRQGFDQGLTRLEKLFYFVLIAVSNKDGVSFHNARRREDDRDQMAPLRVHVAEGAADEYADLFLACWHGSCPCGLTGVRERLKLVSWFNRNVNPLRRMAACRGAVMVHQAT
jgi:hypothetical protein